MLLLSLLACLPPEPGADSPGVAELPEGVTLGEVRACPAPLPSVQYTEVGAELGLQPAPPPADQHAEGGTVAVLDVDQDGDLDLVIGYTTSLQLFRREADGFTAERLDDTIMPMLLSLTDLDGDNILDLVVAGQLPSVFLGDGQGFGARQLLDTLHDPYAYNSGSKILAPADFDRDGANDLFAVINSPVNPDAVNLDALSDYAMWGDLTADPPVDPAAVGASGQRRGFDGESLEWQGQRAMYVANDMGTQFGGNVLYTVEDRVFVDQTAACFCGIEHSAMGVDVADWNGDGEADLYVAATPSNSLLTVQPDGSFVDVAASVNALGIREATNQGMTWGAAMLDYDNDGQVDILDAQGDMWTNRDTNPWVLPQPIWMLRQQDGAFVEVGASLGLAQAGSFRSLGADDYNDDGVLDLLITEVVERPQLYLSDGCTADGWIEVAAPIDSRVDVTAGGRTHTAWTKTHFGYGGARAPIAHIGLGAAQTVDGIRVTTPLGDVYDIPAIDARRRVVVGVVPGLPG